MRAVDGVSWSVRAGETLALVGESGCGKSVTALAIMRLLTRPAGRISGGRVTFAGQDLLRLPEREMRALRGRDLAMVFQEPMTSLNPVMTVGAQLTEPLQIHLGMTPLAARARAAELLRLVGIPDPEQRLRPAPASVLRRHAATHHDRDRAGLRPQADHRRRADDCAGRHGAGADPGTAARPVAAARHHRGADHPQPRHRRPLRRPAGGHVCRPDRRGRRRRCRVRRAAAPLHGGAAALRAAAGRGSLGPARHDRGHAAQPASAAVRLPLRPALRRPHRRLRHRPGRCARRAQAGCRPAIAPTRCRRRCPLCRPGRPASPRQPARHCWRCAAW